MSDIVDPKTIGSPLDAGAAGVVGAIGVSGSSGEPDQAVAEAGAAAFG